MKSQTSTSGLTKNRMPVIFFGHGNPTNAIEKNKYTKLWAELGKILPPPKAILSLSSHW